MLDSYLSYLHFGRLVDTFDIKITFLGCPSDEYELVCTCDKWLRIEEGYYA